MLKFAPAEFVTEAHTLARLQHTNIVPLFSVHPVGPLVALCMPYFPGPTLAAVLHELRKEPSLPDSGRWLVGRLGLAEEVAGRQQLAQGTYVEAVPVARRRGWPTAWPTPTSAASCTAT